MISEELYFDSLDTRAEGYQRTLWHSLYDLDARSLDVSFYLGEENSPGRPTRRSDFFKFRLK